MIYVRGQPRDFDAWDASGAPGWGWREIGSAFKAIEDHEFGENEWRGVGGPLHIAARRKPDEVCEAFISAGVNMGLPRKQDPNEGEQFGVGYNVHTLRDGKRVSAARAFLDPARGRANLRIATETEVLRIRFEGRCATAVECRDRGGAVIYAASGEIILAAGALNTPKLLQLSGIGPAALLKGLGVEVLHDSPGVGQNLREHIGFFMQHRLRHNLGSNSRLRGAGLLASILRYYLLRDGAMAIPTHQISAYLKSSPDLDCADIQLNFGPQSVTLSHDKVVVDPHPGVHAVGYQMRPESQGAVSITSTDPRQPPKITPNYLNSPVDRAVTIAAVHGMRRLFEQEPMARHVLQETDATAQIRSSDEIIRHVLENGVCGHHAVGTCKMGEDSMAVVDPRLRVYGVGGLRVMDCSVLPTLVSGNTNGPVMAMAWRAADLIQEDFAA